MASPQHHHLPRSPPPASPPMATTRRAESSAAKERRGPSPIQAARPTYRPAATVDSPEKPSPLHGKNNPNYLRPTASSRLDQPSPTSSKLTKKPAASVAPAQPKKFTRTRSMERATPAGPPPQQQQAAQILPSRSLKERAKASPIVTKLPTRPPVKNPSPVTSKARAPVAKKKELPARGSTSVSHHDHLDVLETRSETESVDSNTKFQPDDDEHGSASGEVDHVSAAAELTEKAPELVDPVGEMEEHAKEEEKVEAAQHAKEEARERPKSFSFAGKGVGAVDDELQRKLRARQAWETGTQGGSVVEEKAAAAAAAEGGVVALGGRKEGGGSSGNDVIVEAASKLPLEKRKNKVLALVGAFETVMSLQEQPETPSPAKAETPARGVATSESALPKHEEEVGVVEPCEQRDAAPAVVEEEEEEEEEESDEAEEAEVVVAAVETEEEKGGDGDEQRGEGEVMGRGGGD